MTTRVSHTKEDVVLKDRVEVPAKGFEPDIAKYVMVPKNARARHILVEKRLGKLKAFSEKTRLNRVEIKGRKLGIITDSVCYNYLKEQYPDASFLKLGFLYPFCDGKIIEFAKTVKKLVVVEELSPFLEEHLKTLGIRFKAKDPSFRVGELLPEFMEDVIEGKAKEAKQGTARRPLLCPGCPHRPVFVTLKKLKLIVTGDIGCYTLAAIGPLSTLHSCICMGAGVTLHEGLRRALPNGRIVGVLGDSTFVHSGITGLISAAYNKCKGIIIILDNSTTAMTGCQNHPATGRTIRNEPTKRLILEDICRSCGADNVDVIDPHNIDELEKLFKQRLSEDALSVIITRSPCKLIDRSRQPAPSYDKDLCRSCGLCLKIDCPAIKEIEGGFIEINHNICTGCNLCVQICPFGALKKNEE
jgi:indolepyruvate ferredoxin oxidoreductase alpha subunit